jgi:uncharacterized protein (TIGR02757 family)
LHLIPRPLESLDPFSMNSLNHIPDNIIQLLEDRASYYNKPEFIEADPIQVPHQFSKKENIEIAGFLTATISWGQRITIIKNAIDLIRRMDNDPVDFITHATESEFKVLDGFVHRTFQSEDCKFFVKALKNIYLYKGGLGGIFENAYSNSGSVKAAIMKFRQEFFDLPHPVRTEKHVANVAGNASGKRLNMFLRWMVRRDDCGVDFGIWDKIDPAGLFVPLDVHTGNIARKLGLLMRKQDDWKAVEELTLKLRSLDPADPVKYDYALFGLGRYEK